MQEGFWRWMEGTGRRTGVPLYTLYLHLHHFHQLYKVAGNSLIRLGNINFWCPLFHIWASPACTPVVVPWPPSAVSWGVKTNQVSIPQVYVHNKPTLVCHHLQTTLIILFTLQVRTKVQANPPPPQVNRSLKRRPSLRARRASSSSSHRRRRWRSFATIDTAPQNTTSTINLATTTLTSAWPRCGARKSRTNKAIESSMFANVLLLWIKKI